MKKRTVAVDSFVPNVQAEQVSPIVVGIVFLKTVPLLGTVAYGSLAGNRHRRIPQEYTNLIPELRDGSFGPFSLYFGAPGQEQLYLLVRGELEKTSIRWKRLNKSVVAVERVPGLRIPYQFGNSLIAVSNEPIKGALEGRLVVVPSSVIPLPSSNSEK